jgi:hypothetical protein
VFVSAIYLIDTIPILVLLNFVVWIFASLLGVVAPIRL